MILISHSLFLIMRGIVNNNSILLPMTIALFATVSVGFASQITPKVIYGEDHRLDMYQVSNPEMLALADSTLAIIPKSEMSLGSRDYRITSRNFGKQFGVCQDEPYHYQPTAANCSGSLIADDLILTAGHCVNSSSCDSYNYVFNYKMMDALKTDISIKSEDVYTCKEVVSRELSNSEDYAIVRLDRSVLGHRPLALSSTNAEVGDEVFVIGHPSGLPTKLASGAKVRSMSSGFFVANLDTYGGNSGSAVFSTKRNEVVGVLVRGEQDFKYDRVSKCSRSFTCDDNACRGEDVTNISLINEALSK